MTQDFVVADPHFNHANILRYANRPFSSIEEHNETLIDNWNSIVPKNGTVRILGDFAWSDHNHFLQRLNGRKILVVGSHDRMPQEVLRNFTEVHPGGAMLNIGNHQFYCDHTCHRVWEKGHYGVGHLFAHSHARLETYNMSGDVGVDSDLMYKKYFPNPLENIIAFMNLRAAEMEKAGRTRDERGKRLYFQDDVWWLKNGKNAELELNAP